MARTLQKSCELEQFQAILQADRALVNAAESLRKLGLVESASKIDNIRMDLAEPMAPIQDRAYAEVHIVSNGRA
jgi:hypothetical protein